MPTGILTFAPIRRISLLAPLLSVSPFSGCGRPKRRGRHEQRRSFHREVKRLQNGLLYVETDYVLAAPL